jgi:hypothetical protein
MTLKELEARIQTIEDIEAIRKLQHAYNYYLEHWQEDEVVDLFSDSPDVTVEVGETGLYKGKEGARKFFAYRNVFGAKTDKPTPEFLHLLFPLSGIIDVDPGNKTAKGRWYGFGCLSIPAGEKIRPVFITGVWENEYIKENGKWKFKKLFFNTIFRTPYEDGWVKTPYVKRPHPDNLPAPGPNTHFEPYPNANIFPYHYKNPVTDK